MRPVILFDIDHTLINNRKLAPMISRHLLGKFRILGRELFAGDWEGFRNAFKPEFYALGYILFGSAGGFSKRKGVLEKSFFNPRFFRDSVFSDAVPILKYLKGKATLGIFSQGPRSFQVSKLTFSGLEKFFEKEYIFVFPPFKAARAKEVLAKLPSKKVYFVDDREDVARVLLNHKVKVFTINRDNDSPSPAGSIKVSSLEDLKKFF